ncbi:ROK family protein [Streptomyces sp. NRRL B-24484]|uniref:ROK family protein n=1 Tax=Streptomyces sp. NRRL B-24484 TaxID=1463833 RepID=UPI0005B87921|nr:ROK family protein [Streptomyces sp. NRRL B-24484]
MSPAAPCVLAVDVGGTGIKATVLDADLAVRHTTWRPTGRERGPRAVVDTVTALVTELLDTAGRHGTPPQAVGLALPGIVDETTGTAVHSATIGWRNVTFHDIISGATDLPVAVTHDVRAGGTAEARLGAGRGHDHFLFVPIGTSIGAVIMTGSRAGTGAHHCAGKIGHLRIRPNGEPCTCGARGCAETYASAAAVARRYAAVTGRTADAAEVAARTAAGELPARAVWDEAVDALADMLVLTTTVLDPPLIVLGGGLSQAGDLLLDPLRTAMAAKATVSAVPTVEAAEHGERAGCLGAGLQALDLIPGPVRTGARSL